MSKQAALEFLEGQLTSIVAERKQLDAEEQAIRLLLARHKGIRQIESTPPANGFIPYSAQEDSVSSLVVKALREAGRPQKTEQLIDFLARHGKQTTSATLRSTIYLKKGKLFNVVSPGLYELAHGVS